MCNQAAELIIGPAKGVLDVEDEVVVGSFDVVLRSLKASRELGKVGSELQVVDSKSYKVKLRIKEATNSA